MTGMNRFHVASVHLVSDGEKVLVELSCGCGHWDYLATSLGAAEEALKEHVNDPHPYAE